MEDRIIILLCIVIVLARLLDGEHPSIVWVLLSTVRVLGGRGFPWRVICPMIVFRAIPCVTSESIFMFLEVM